jgi:hemolysin III
VEQQARAAEEIANAVTHGVGAVLSVAGGSVLIVLAVIAGGGWELLGVTIFVAALILLYSASTCYHMVRAEFAKRRLQVLDHCAIYVLIAGTYTPFTLAVRGAWGWTMFGLAWAFAAAGVVFKLVFTGRFPRISTAIYLAMGWMILIAAGPMVRHLDTATLIWLAAGGITYTVGTAFYHSRRIPFAHAVWHVFVIAGSVCHGIAVATHL